MRQLLPLLTLISALTLATIFHAWVSEAKPSPLTLTVSPLIGFAPLDLVILLRLQPAPEDRSLRVVFESSEYFRSSDWSLPGADSPRLFRVEWKRVGAGEADVHALVWTATRTVRASASQHVIVAGR